MKGIAKIFKEQDIDMYYVGGCVRDEIMNITPDDTDICLVGGKRDTIQMILENLESIGVIKCFTPVFGNFPIWIVEIEGEKYEFAMARSEKKTGDNHQAFECSTEGITIEDDLSRRDLTINAMAKNVLTEEIIDPFYGREHIKNKIAHPVSKAFSEDSLRVIRAARFIARFNLSPTGEMLNYCEAIKPEGISMERIGKELMKFFEKGGDAFKFFGFLSDVGWLQAYFLEVHAMIGVPQSKTHHPEGDVYNHTMHCVNAALGWFQKTVMLCHDMGKVVTTTVNGIIWNPFDIDIPLEGMKVQALGHEEESVRIMKTFLRRIFFCSHKDINRMCILVKHHMIRAIYNEKSAKKVVRRTLRDLIRHELEYFDLFLTVKYDLLGRPPLPCPQIEIGRWLAEDLLQKKEMTPIVTGKLLLAEGLSPSPEFGKIVDKALELQDRGTLNKDNWKQRLIGAGFKQLKSIL